MNYNLILKKCRYVFVEMQNAIAKQQVKRRRSSSTGLYARASSISNKSRIVRGSHAGHEAIYFDPVHYNSNGSTDLNSTIVIRQSTGHKIRLPAIRALFRNAPPLRLEHLYENVHRAMGGGNSALWLAAVLAFPLLNLFIGSGAVVSQISYHPLTITMPLANQLVANRELQQGRALSTIDESIGLDPSQFQQVQVAEYSLQPGDTLSGMAVQFDLNMDTIASFNAIQDVRRMRAGTSYRIPDRDGLLYTIKRGDTVSSVADHYNVSTNAILDVNNLISSNLQSDTVIFVPGARMSSFELKLILGELLINPHRGHLSSGFGYRSDPFTRQRRFHNGVDFVGTIGDSIRAAMPGVVVHTESQSGNYGNFVIIRHQNGFQTLYAHLSSHNVSRGQYVSQGERIGRLGSSGRSTGPHLHFSVIRHGEFVNPIYYLH